MSNTFCLPVRLSVSPRPLGAVIIAAHCLPLPLLAAAPAAWAWAALALAGMSLAWELHRQRAAAAATALEAAAGGWLLHRQDGRRAEVDLLDRADFGGFMLLLLREDGKKFRLAARADAQQRGQWHRLRVLLRWQRQPPDRASRN
ncbi:MAG: hypothetical protein OD817_02645 [Gammaproteobacteria bacterium]